VVLNRGELIIDRGIPKNGIIPELEIGISGDEVGKDIPFIFGSNETRSI